MTKRQLVDAAIKLCERDLIKADIAEALDCIINVITHELESGNNVEIKNFAKFGVKTRAAREGRNPQTGEAIHIPAKEVTFCNLSKGIKVSPRL